MIFAKREKNPEGDYVDRENLRWGLIACRNVRPAIGWTMFNELDDCLKEWCLTYDPLPKELQEGLPE